MKKIFALVMICVALLTTSKVNAETRWGVVAGMDLTNLKFNQDLISTKNVAGFTGGLTGELMMPGIGFGVDASLLYTMRGAKVNFGEQTLWASQGLGNERCTLHYIEIPLNLKFKYTRLDGVENVIAPIAFAGPDFSFLVAHSKNPAIEYPAGEFGVHVGIGAEIMRKFQLNASYGWAISYALKTKQLDDFSAKNRTFKVTLSYMF